MEIALYQHRMGVVFRTSRVQFDSFLLLIRFVSNRQSGHASKPPTLPLYDPASFASLINSREKPVPRCLHRRPQPGVRGRRQALVRVYSAAAAGIAGVLRGVQEHPDPDCHRRRKYASQPVASPKIADPSRRAPRLESSRAACARPSLDMDASVEGPGSRRSALRPRPFVLGW